MLRRVGKVHLITRLRELRLLVHEERGTETLHTEIAFSNRTKNLAPGNCAQRLLLEVIFPSKQTLKPKDGKSLEPELCASAGLSAFHPTKYASSVSSSEERKKTVILVIRRPRRVAFP